MLGQDIEKQVPTKRRAHLSLSDLLLVQDPSAGQRILLLDGLFVKEVVEEEEGVQDDKAVRYSPATLPERQVERAAKQVKRGLLHAAVGIIWLSPFHRAKKMQERNGGQGLTSQVDGRPGLVRGPGRQEAGGGDDRCRCRRRETDHRSNGAHEPGVEEPVRDRRAVAVWLRKDARRRAWLGGRSGGGGGPRLGLEAGPDPPRKAPEGPDSLQGCLRGDDGVHGGLFRSFRHLGEREGVTEGRACLQRAAERLEAYTS